LAVPPHFDSDSGLVVPSLVVLIRCGQDYKDDTFEDGDVDIVYISCPEFNGSYTTLSAYKDGIKIDPFSGTILFGPIPTPTDDIFGTYTFVIENNCGRDVKVTRISRLG